MTTEDLEDRANDLAVVLSRLAQQIAAAPAGGVLRQVAPFEIDTWLEQFRATEAPLRVPSTRADRDAARDELRKAIR